MFQSDNPILLIVDVQKAIDFYGLQNRSNPDAESFISQLLDAWRMKDLPIIHVRHSSKFEDSPYHRHSNGFNFKNCVAPKENEIVVTKSENCAFINTDLERYIKEYGSSELVICGVLINHSVDATVRVASALGYSVYLPQDATAAFGVEAANGKKYSAEDVHWLCLANLSGEYCTVITAAEALGV